MCMAPSGAARLFLPGARPSPAGERAYNKNSVAEETHQGRANSMSSESKTDDWSKPAAMAIPKGGYFQDKVEQGRYGPIFPKTPACYGFSILAKIVPGTRRRVLQIRQKHRGDD